MNSNELFSIALGLSHSWHIKNVSFLASTTGSSQDLIIDLDFLPGTTFLDQFDEPCKAYDTEIKQWQHLNFFQHRCFINARIPRIITSDGKTQVVTVPWARKDSGFTLLFEVYAMLLIENEMPVNKAASTLKVVPHRLWRVFNYWINKAVSADVLSSITHIGIDETSSKKGHKYVTVVADLTARRTIFVTQGKDGNTLANFAQTLENKGGSVANINTISMDMSPAFIGGAVQNFPQAQLVFDKFHTVKLLNEAMDEVRKLERQENEALRGHKYLFLRNYSKLKKKQVTELHLLIESYPKLGEAYKLKTLFIDMFNIESATDAKAYLTFWCELAVESKLFPFMKFATTIKKHWAGMAAYFDKKVSNGLLESINSKIQLAKKRARGYRKTENFINMIYFLTAKLKFDYPHQTS